MIRSNNIKLWSGQKYIDSALVLVVILVVWQVMAKVVGAVGLSAPIATVISAISLLSSSSFWPNVGATMYPFVLAVLIETVTGVAFGLFLGVNRLAQQVFEPILVGFYALPKIVFYPIILLTLGIGVASETTFALLHGILPIILFTMNAVRLLRPIYMKTARVLKLTRFQTLRSVAFPAVMPELFSGLRIGYSATLLGVLFSEMFGSKSGLGFLLMNAIESNRVSDIFSLALLLAAFAIAMNISLLAIDRRLHRRL